MASPPDFPERRKDHALRVLYNRVGALEEENNELAREVAVLKEGAVTKGWLIGGVLTVSLAALGGAQSFRSGLQESAEKPLQAQAKAIAKQGERLDHFIESQSATNIKTEAMYLRQIELRPREEVREAVLRSTPPKENQPWPKPTPAPQAFQRPKGSSP